MASPETWDPHIEPSNFDLIVVGTGLPQAILSAAAASAGKSVLHLDPNPSYGSSFASLPLHEFTSFLQSQHQTLPLPSPQTTTAAAIPDSAGEEILIPLRTRTLYSGVEITPSSSPIGSSRSFNLDLGGPRVFLCAEPMVDLLMRSSVGNHLEFKNLEASFIWTGEGLRSVPDSRAAIFKDSGLGLMEKNQLMRFFKLVQGHFSAAESEEEEDGQKILEEDLETPFLEFLDKHRLSPQIKPIILYAIAMLDFDQGNPVSRENMIKTKDGIQSLFLYSSSVGRFPNASGAFIYPLYGQGELPQAFCRIAAVKGALYVLRMPVTDLIYDKVSNHYKGIKIGSGQHLFCEQLILDPSFVISSPTLPLPSDSSDYVEENMVTTEVACDNSPPQRVARAVCITRSSLKTDISNMFMVFPPKSLGHEQETCIRGIQLSSNAAACPSDTFVVYLSILCADTNQGKSALRAAINALYTISNNDSTGNQSLQKSEELEMSGKPDLVWHALYVQDVNESFIKGVNSCPMPDARLDYRDLLESTNKMFQEMYPDCEFFPEVPPSSEDSESFQEVRPSSEDSESFRPIPPSSEDSESFRVLPPSSEASESFQEAPSSVNAEKPVV